MFDKNSCSVDANTIAFPGTPMLVPWPWLWGRCMLCTSLTAWISHTLKDNWPCPWLSVHLATAATTSGPPPANPSGGCHDLSLVAKKHWVCFSCSVSPNMIIHELTDWLLSQQNLYVTFFSNQLKHLPAKEVKPLGDTQGVTYRIMNPITRNS